MVFRLVRGKWFTTMISLIMTLNPLNSTMCWEMYTSVLVLLWRQMWKLLSSDDQVWWLFIFSLFELDLLHPYFKQVTLIILQFIHFIVRMCLLPVLWCWQCCWRRLCHLWRRCRAHWSQHSLSWPTPFFRSQPTQSPITLNIITFPDSRGRFSC